MSFLDSLSQFTGNVGRGLEDVFTLGGTELARKFGGQGAKNILNPLGTALGANMEAGAVGGLGSLGMGGGAAGAGTAPAGTMAMNSPLSLYNAAPAQGITSAGATNMGIGSPLGLTPTASMQGAGTSAGSSSPMLHALMAMRSMGGGQPQQQAQRPNMMGQIYSMYPSLRPGAPLGMRPGGM
jgi:hypothetical protein